MATPKKPAAPRTSMNLSSKSKSIGRNKVKDLGPGAKAKKGFKPSTGTGKKKAY